MVSYKRLVMFVIPVFAAGILLGIVVSRSRPEDPDELRVTKRVEQRQPEPAPTARSTRSPAPLADASTGPLLVDLSPHFNAELGRSWHRKNTPNDLSELPRGRQVLLDTPFWVQGIVQLSAKIDRSWVKEYPAEVRGITLGIACRRLHFLQGTGLTGSEGAEIGMYVVHYADNQSQTIPIVYGKHVRDWWHSPEDSQPTESAVAWTGTNAATRKEKKVLRLYMMTWDNPRPGVPVTSLDFVSSMADSAPFLLAATAERPD